MIPELGGVNFSEVALALFSGTFATIVAWVAFRGKTEEVSADHTRTLIEGQATRINRLEDRLTAIESQLLSTQERLRYELRRSDELREALASSVGYLTRLDNWLESGGAEPMPIFGNLLYLRSVVKDDFLRNE